MNISFRNSFIKYLKITFVIVFLFMTVLYRPAFAEPSHETASDTLSLRKSPYLIFNGNNTQMQVMWQSKGTIDCSISWGTSTDYSLGSAKTKEYGGDHQHAYTIQNLKPGIKYFYKVVAGEITFSGTFYAAPKNDDDQLKFFVYGDSRSFPYVHNVIAGSIISDFKKDPSMQTLVLSVGDMVTSGAEESSWDSEVFNPAYPNIGEMMASIPLLSCVGNHERLKEDPQNIDENYTLFKKYFPYPFIKDTYWSFDYGPAHIVILDQYADNLGTKQIEWLTQDLEASKKLWKFIVLHEPGWSAGLSGNETRENNKKIQKVVQPILEKYGVTAVFAGHNHYYARALVNGIYHITTGGGGAPLYDPQPYSDKVITTSKSYHYCTVDINKDTMVFKALKPDGTVIDTFTLTASMEYRKVPR